MMKVMSSHHRHQNWIVEDLKIGYNLIGWDIQIECIFLEGHLNKVKFQSWDFGMGVFWIFKIYLES